MIETVCSFAMAFWYLQRNGIPFSDLWFKFGEIPSGIDVDYYNARVNEASSIYFINLVIMCVSPSHGSFVSRLIQIQAMVQSHGRADSPSLNLSASTCIQ
jgi:hypothetical protein